MKRVYLLGAALSSALILSNAARADALALTAAGTADGFTLSTFATTNPGYNGCCGGPFGVAMTSDGNVLVGTGSGPLYVFNDVDGQTTGTALFTQTGNTSTYGFASAGGNAYGGYNLHFVEFNSDGTVNHVLSGVNATPYLGMWGDPLNGHIIATSYSGLIDIDPLANGGLGSFRVINSGVYGDGVSVSPDGTTAYVEQGSINGYDIATGAQVFNSGSLFNSPDGTGVISGGLFNGDIVVNDNSGSIYLLDPTTKAATIIATGGSRGDYTSPDLSNGSLFLDSADSVHRLSCGPGCSIGGPVSSGVPEPSSMAGLGAFAVLGLAAIRRRKRSR